MKKNKQKKNNFNFKIHYNYNKYFSDEIFCIDEEEVLPECEKLLERTDIEVKKSNIIIIYLNEIEKIIECEKPKIKIIFPKVILYSEYILNKQIETRPIDIGDTL